MNERDPFALLAPSSFLCYNAPIKGVRPVYIWTAVDAREALAPIRRAAERECRALGIENPAFTLPMHVLLKISFSLPEAAGRAAMGEMGDFLKGHPPFSLETEGLEQQGQILWISMRPSAALCGLHAGLDDLLERRYAVPRHPFDRDFRFHATLIYGGAPEQLSRLHALLNTVPLPAAFPAERYLIGTSDSGAAGTYQVNQIITPEKHKEVIK